MVKLGKTFIIILILIIPLFAFTQAKGGKKLLNRKATFYHNKFVNRKTSSGEKFVQTKYTAAHKTIPLNTLVKVTNENNGRSVIVKVNDRCPKRGVIDLSLVAAKRLDMIEKGVATVKIEILNDDYLDIWEKQDEIFNMFDRVEEKDNLRSSYFDLNSFDKSINLIDIFYNSKSIPFHRVEKESLIAHKTNLKTSSHKALEIAFIAKEQQYYYINIGHFNSLNKFS
ncbi:MAG: septal ring lytic transglycosylase RlpA family protein [Bacteroidales bacterium]|nr:septal ring lytic transglycosylase RlpA family protein [Bacteroidales bacterium]